MWKSNQIEVIKNHVTIRSTGSPSSRCIIGNMSPVGFYKDLYGRLRSIAKLEFYWNIKAETFIPCFCVCFLATVAIPARSSRFIASYASPLTWVWCMIPTAIEVRPRNTLSAGHTVNLGPCGLNHHGRNDLASELQGSHEEKRTKWNQESPLWAATAA